jgi:hypothetical protein
MDDEGYELIRKLIADIEGAPFPNTIDRELYLIWYEHVQSVAQKALEYLDLRGEIHGRGEEDQPDLDV